MAGIPRRRFLAGAATLGLAARAEAQAPARAPVVGVLTVQRKGDSQHRRNVAAFRETLQALGWVDGKNVVIEERFGEGQYEPLGDLTADLISLKAAVLVGATTPLIRIAQATTKTTPIVMIGILDPIGSGFVETLARPGRNITGVAGLPGHEFVGKHLELLRQLVPGIKRMAVLMNSANAAHGPLAREAERTATTLQIRVTPYQSTAEGGDLARTFSTMKNAREEALVVLTDAAFFGVRSRIADLAATHRVPAVYGLSVHAEAGGLVSYGPSISALWQRAAAYVDKILKGAQPAAMPVEQPATFELVLNAKAARAL